MGNDRQEKQDLRKRMLAKRDSKRSAELDVLSAKITERLRGLPEIVRARVISTYVSKGSEVRTLEIIRSCLAEGKTVLVPVTDRINKRLVFSELTNPDLQLEPGTFGIPEPGADALKPIPLEQADAILVPGVAWDIRGNRVGYGGGFYDRAINSLRTDPIRVGLSYDFQIVNRIPATSYDTRVEKIVTEKRVIDVGRS